jgi:hypothetical protein
MLKLRISSFNFRLRIVVHFDVRIDAVAFNDPLSAFTRQARGGLRSSLQLNWRMSSTPILPLSVKMNRSAFSARILSDAEFLVRLKLLPPPVSQA